MAALGGSDAVHNSTAELYLDTHLQECLQLLSAPVYVHTPEVLQTSTVSLKRQFRTASLTRDRLTSLEQLPSMKQAGGP